MSALIGIAVNMLPTLAKFVTKDTAPETRDLVISVVRDVLGTDDPSEASSKASDPGLSGELRLRLAEVENAAEARAQDAAAHKRAMEFEQLRLEMQEAREARERDLDRFKATMGDIADARETMTKMNEQDSGLAWAPAIVSVVVSMGFFVTLTYLIFGGFNVTEANQDIFQIVNIAVGALTAAFATVVSFWLGSSDGSRLKDAAAARAQTVAAHIQRENTQTTRDIVSQQTRQTAALIEKVADRAPTAHQQTAPGRAQKDALQFHQCVDVILQHEGGYVDHADDPGGATNMGITRTTLASWLGRDVTKDEVRGMNRDTAMEIYRTNYWNALNCDGLPAGIDLVVFDFGVNAGVRRAAKMLQKVLHVEPDGQIGPITIGAAQAINARHVVDAFSDQRLSYYKSLHHWGTFGKGWARRTKAAKDLALSMLT